MLPVPSARYEDESMPNLIELYQKLKRQKSELRQNMVELHEASKYLQDLRPSCDDIRSTFEERKKRLLARQHARSVQAC